MDNLFSKCEILLDKVYTVETDVYLYFTEVLKEIKELYMLNEFDKIKSIAINELEYVHNLILFEFFKKELMKTSSTKGNIIDVTEE